MKILFIYLLSFIVFNSLLEYTSAELNLCSPDNTASNSGSVSIFQTNGLCENTCAGYAYAILYGKTCYCSNYTPSSTVDISDCSETCPGYPLDSCGDTSKGNYGYILLNTPSGTQGSESSSSFSSSSSTSSSSSSTSASTSPGTSSSSSSSTSSSASSATSASSDSSSSSITSSVPSSSSISSSSSSSGSSTQQPSTILSIETVSGSGVITTEFISISPTSSSSTNSPSVSANNAESTGQVSSNKSKNSFWEDKGKVAGTFTAVGIVALAIIIVIVFCLLKRKAYEREEAPNELEKGYMANLPTETPSSSFGLQRDDSYKSQHTSFSFMPKKSIIRNGSKKINGIGTEGHRKSVSNGDSLVPIVEVDQRLDPGSMFMNLNESRKSLADDYDYSRRILKVTNPDD